MNNIGICEELCSFAGALRGLLKYLMWLLTDFEQAQGKVQFVWDWEMFQEAIYPDNATSVYSGVLWYGLECLEASSAESQEWKVVIPEGTRRELVRHLNKLVSRYRNRVRKISKPQKESKQLTRLKESLAPAWSRPDWQEVLGDIFELRRIEQATAKLLVIIQRYARPAPFSPSEIAGEKVQYYKERLADVRTASKAVERNVADAFNLATVESLEAPYNTTSMGTSAYLVTATIAVHKACKNISRDPLYFVFAAEMLRRYPDDSLRQQLVLAMVSRVSSILVSLGEMPTEDQEDRTRRAEVVSFIRGLAHLYDDPVLMELGQLTSRATRAVENSAMQAKSVFAELDIPRARQSGRLGRLSALLERVSRVLVELGSEKVTPTDLDLHWVQKSDNEHTKRYNMVDWKNCPIMEAEKVGREITIRWQTDDSIAGLCDALNKLSRSMASGGTIRVWTRLLGESGIKKATAGSNSDITRGIIKFENMNKISLLRVDVGDYKIWYTTGETRQDANKGNRLPMAHIAVRLAPRANLALVADFFGSTTAEWCFPAAVATLLEELA